MSINPFADGLFKKWEFNYMIRQTASDKLKSWGITQTYDTMASFLGYGSSSEMIYGFTPDDAKKLEVLYGPYGRTILRATLIRREPESDQIVE